jgi:hypothetical protein
MTDRKPFRLALFDDFENWSEERKKWWNDLLDAEDEALRATGGILACSPEIYKEMQEANERAYKEISDASKKERLDSTSQ